MIKPYQLRGHKHGIRRRRTHYLNLSTSILTFDEIIQRTKNITNNIVEVVYPEQYIFTQANEFINLMKTIKEAKTKLKKVTIPHGHFDEENTDQLFTYMNELGERAKQKEKEDGKKDNIEIKIIDSRFTLCLDSYGNRMKGRA